jgi:hypothetical protein
MQGAAGGSGGPCCLAHLATKPRVEPSSRGRSNLITPTPDTNGCPGGAAALSSAATTASGGSISGSASWLPDAPEGARRTRRTMWPDGAAQRSRQRQTDFVSITQGAGRTHTLGAITRGNHNHLDSRGRAEEGSAASVALSTVACAVMCCRLHVPLRTCAFICTMHHDACSSRNLIHLAVRSASSVCLSSCSTNRRAHQARLQKPQPRCDQGSCRLTLSKGGDVPAPQPAAVHPAPTEPAPKPSSAHLADQNVKRRPRNLELVSNSVGSFMGDA